MIHPKVLGSSDKTRDFTFMKCYPILDKIDFSGEKILMLPIKFQLYPLLTNNDRVEYFAFGDGSQTLT